MTSRKDRSPRGSLVGSMFVYATKDRVEARVRFMSSRELKALGLPGKSEVLIKAMRAALQDAEMRRK